MRPVSLGRCPECGQSVRESLRGGLLRFGDPTWLLVVRDGAQAIFIAVLTGLGSAVVGAVGAWFSAPLLIVPGLLGCWVALLVGAGGTWNLAERDPFCGDKRFDKARRTVRGAAAALMVGGGLGIVVIVLLPLTAVVWIAGEVAKFRFVELLARRIPSDRLAREARLIRIGILICCGAIVAGSAVGFSTASAVIAQVCWGIAGLGGAGLLGVLIMQAPLMRGLSKAIQAQISLMESIEAEDAA